MASISNWWATSKDVGRAEFMPIPASNLSSTLKLTIQSTTDTETYPDNMPYDFTVDLNDGAQMTYPPGTRIMITELRTDAPYDPSRAILQRDLKDLSRPTTVPSASDPNRCTLFSDKHVHGDNDFKYTIPSQQGPVSSPMTDPNRNTMLDFGMEYCRLTFRFANGDAGDDDAYLESSVLYQATETKVCYDSRVIGFPGASNISPFYLALQNIKSVSKGLIDSTNLTTSGISSGNVCPSYADRANDLFIRNQMASRVYATTNGAWKGDIAASNSLTKMDYEQGLGRLNTAFEEYGATVYNDCPSFTVPMPDQWFTAPTFTGQETTRTGQLLHNDANIFSRLVVIQEHETKISYYFCYPIFSTAYALPRRGNRMQSGTIYWRIFDDLYKNNLFSFEKQYFKRLCLCDGLPYGWTTTIDDLIAQLPREVHRTDLIKQFFADRFISAWNSSHPNDTQFDATKPEDWTKMKNVSNYYDSYVDLTHQVNNDPALIPPGATFPRYTERVLYSILSVNTPDMYAGRRQFYVMCDQVENSRLGNDFKPHLATILLDQDSHIKEKVEGLGYRNTFHRLSVQKPQFKPINYTQTPDASWSCLRTLKNNQLTSLRFRLVDDFGDPVPLVQGTVVTIGLVFFKPRE